MTSPITRISVRRRSRGYGKPIAAIVLIALVFLLGAYVEAPALAALDAAALEAMSEARSAAWDAFATLFDALGSTAGFAALTLLLAVVWFALGRRRDAALTLGVTLLAWILNAIVKHAFARPRPEADALFGADGFSYPSGNATIAAALIGFAALAAADRSRGGAAKAAIATVAVLLVLAFGATRVYAGVHYPTDIIGGYMLGLAAMLIAAAFRK